jgi:pimeloyl-ACP methyl ester carboxylesterase
MKTTMLLAVLLPGLCAAAAHTELGEINGARFRIDMPEKWNGGLVVYCHGYSDAPGTFEDKPNPFIDVFVSQGYAFIQSGFAAGGWAIQEGLQDTEALRRYFVRKYGAPKETYVTGHSMGGFLTLVLMESFPSVYDAGLPLCGPLGAASWYIDREPLDLRAVFDYYFPDALPAPDRVPATFKMSKDIEQEITLLLDSKPGPAEIVRRWSGIRSNKELSHTLVFFTYVLMDLEQRGGGNPFDNRNIIYTGTPDDNALNDGVKRYTADPRAREYAHSFYTPTGKLTRPMLAIHTTYDPIVQPWVPDAYARLTEQAGTANLFVQQYVKHDGHCAINNTEVARGFAELREWKNHGVRPAAGANQ